MEKGDVGSHAVFSYRREREHNGSQTLIYERKEGIYATFEWFHVQEVVAVHLRLDNVCLFLASFHNGAIKIITQLLLNSPFSHKMAVCTKQHRDEGVPCHRPPGVYYHVANVCFSLV